MADHLLPPNATEEEKAIASALSRLSDVPVPIRQLWNPDTCPVEMLPWLAWAVSVDVWDARWPEARKRQVIKAAITVHRHKGTPFALEEAFRAINIRATVKEWFEYGGDPHTFKLAVDVLDEGLDQAAYATITEVAKKTKNVRSHLDSIEVFLAAEGSPRGGGALLSGEVATLYPWNPGETITHGALFSGATVHMHEVTTLYPQGA